MSQFPNSFSILLVEDEQPHQRLFIRGVTRAKIDAEVICVETGRNAIAFLESYASAVEKQPLIVILDINIPGINGIEVFEQMRANPHLASIPVAILSTSDEPDELARCKALGCFAYFVKPVDMEELAKTMMAELSA
jgi:CheY-like chemotaxis protein